MNEQSTRCAWCDNLVDLAYVEEVRVHDEKNIVVGIEMVCVECLDTQEW